LISFGSVPMTEIRYALRSLRNNPGFTLVAILSLALGIGANTAIYSVIRAVLLDPLPVHAPQELFEAGWKRGGGRSTVMTMGSLSFRDERSGNTYSSNFSYAQYRSFRQSLPDVGVFAFSYAVGNVSVSFGNQPLIGSSLLLSGNFFPALGVSTILGRPLADFDDKPDAQPVAVISYGFWQRAFGGDPNVIGRPVHLNGSPFVIVGVTPPRFSGMSKGGILFAPTDVFIPLAAEPLVYTRAEPDSRSLFNADDRWWLHVTARIRPDQSFRQAETQLNSTFLQSVAASSFPAVQQMQTLATELRLFPSPRGVDVLSRPMQQPLVILGGVVGIVLLIACANIANLMLARGVARQKETSIRLALGSGWWRLMRGVLLESVLLSISGGLLGTFVGSWGGRILLTLLSPGGDLTALNVAIDGRLLALTIGISGAAAVLFGLLPALRIARSDAAPVMKQVTTGSQVSPLKGATVLMVVQVAISVPLIVGAALFLQTVYKLGKVDLGFNPDRLTIFRLDPSLNGYNTDRIERLYGDVLQRIAAIPGVTSATLSDVVLMSRLQNNWEFSVDDKRTNLKFARVGSAYFDTFRIPIVAGRAIGIQDDSRSLRVAVVNESAARSLFDSGLAIGRHVTMESNPAVAFEVVGVAKDSRYTSPRDPMPPTIFLPYAQTTLGRLGGMEVALRTAVSSPGLAEQIRAAVAEVDREVPVTDLKTQSEQIDQTLGPERTFMQLLVAFGAFALLLACVGLHGVTAYAVARRTSEIGIRVALGAKRSDVVWLVLRQVILITGAGLFIGIPTSIALGGLVRSVLYGVESNDPASLITAVVVMVAISLLAGFLPTQRALRLDPLKALRYE
jgi:predicted permease